MRIDRKEIGRLHKHVTRYVEDLLEAHVAAMEIAEDWQERAEAAEAQVVALASRVAELEAALAAAEGAE